MKIFISYRRQDNAELAVKIRDRFVDRYGRNNVFIDFDSIPPAAKWKECIEREILNCTAFVLVIGPDWINILRHKASTFVEDIVVYEIELALQNNKIIVPICIEGAKPPLLSDLPSSIRSILDFNIAFLDSGQSFVDKCKHIVDSVDKQVVQPQSITPKSHEQVVDEHSKVVRLRLEIPEEKFNADELVKIVSQLVSIGVNDISIVSISAGSVVVSLRLPTDAASKLVKIYSENPEKFGFKVSELTIVEQSRLILPHVFMSYSHDDTQTMQRIKSIFKEKGFVVWTDEGIEIGTSNWQLAIEKAIGECLCVVCILTPSAKHSHWVREELAYASFHEKQIYMVHTHGDYRQVAILGFAVEQLVDVRDRTLYESRMSQLCERIIDEFQGQDIAPEIQKVMPQQLPDILDLEDYVAAETTDYTIPQIFMPATIPAHEEHELVVQRGKEYTTTIVFPINGTFVTIGRDKGSTIPIDHGSVSREHCQLVYTNDGFLVRDMDSINGTYINAERIRIKNLKDGDVLQIGPNISLSYRITKK